MKNYFYILKNCRLFKNKTIDDIGRIFTNIHYRIETFEENDIVFSPMQTAVKIGIILSGTADVQKLIPTGKITIIERKKAADLLAESSVFSTFEYYPDTITVCEPSKILFLSKNELQKLFDIDKEILINFMAHISNSTLILKHKIGILSLDSIQEKICGYLLYNYKISGSYVVELPFSKKCWSEYMNVSRTSLSRELRKLEIEGILSFNKRTIKIEDLKRLEKRISL